MFRKFFSLVSLFILFVPLGVLADTAVLPEFNNLCWKKEECAVARLQLIQNSSHYSGMTSDAQKKIANDGWDNTVAAGECQAKEWGKCLPPTTIITEIAFGGNRNFASIGDFIQKNYIYAISVAAILAVVMLIVAGVQWIASGGNSEAISSAKKRIVGAIIGLFLAYGSYFILNTVNPALVAFRLPQAWMIRAQKVLPQFCSDGATTTLFATAATAGEQAKMVTTTSGDFTVSITSTPEKFVCGSRFFSRDGGSQTCFGDYCGSTPTRGLCINFNDAGGRVPFKCKPNAILAGQITGSFGLAAIPVVNNDVPIALYALCNEGGKVEDTLSQSYPVRYLGDTRTGAPYFFYESSALNISRACAGSGGPAGFFIGVQVNDETSITGGVNTIIGSSEGVAFSNGIDDWFAVGQSSPGSHSCNVNLSKKAIELSNGQIKFINNSQLACSFLSWKPIAEAAAHTTEFVSHLISKAELEKGYVCNIDITRSEFPAVDNHFVLDLKRIGTACAATGAVAGGAAGLVTGGLLTLPFAAVGCLGGGATAAVVAVFQSDVTSCLWGQ